MRAVVEEIERLVARAGEHPVWGYAHCLRVHDLAVELAEAEGLDYDAEVLRLAALLHDIGLYRAYRLREGADHVRRSASVATRMLRDGNLSPSAIRLVLDAIEHHPPGAPPGRSTEAVLLKDAVALDYLGAVGISRVLARSPPSSNSTPAAPSPTDASSRWTTSSRASKTPPPT
jgi:uncharacterized protein